MRTVIRRIALLLTAVLLLGAAGCGGPGRNDAKSALYPAYVNETGKQRWGYINAKGEFAIKPTYDWAGDFGPDGFAVVESAGRYGVIDRNGKLTVEATYESIERATTGDDLIAREGDKYMVLGRDGAAWIDSNEPISGFSDGLSPFSQAAGDSSRYGYVNEDGKVVIGAQYMSAAPFSGGKAVVGLSEDSYAIIDTSGKQLATLAGKWVGNLGEDLVAFSDPATNKYGYASTAGAVVIPAQFSGAERFVDGYAVVEGSSDSDSHAPKYGLIDKQGRFVITPQYSSLRPIGGGLYAAGKPSDEYAQEEFTLKALVDSTGKQLTSFIFYDIGQPKDGLISVTDLTSTFFVDLTGAKAAGLPTLPGIGELTVAGDIVQAQVDGERSYVSKDGKPIWQGDTTQTLAGGLTIKSVKYRPNRWIMVTYPELSGLNPDVQDSLNAQIKGVFINEGVAKGTDGSPGPDDYLETITEGFSATRYGNLLVIHADGYVYPMGAAHGMPISDDYHYDLTNGKLYTLADLFKSDSSFTDRLQALIKQQMDAATDPYWFEGAEPVVRPDQTFTVTPDGLTIYFTPYEIAPYAAGFPAFDIPWSQIQDIVDTGGAFWTALHATVQ